MAKHGKNTAFSAAPLTLNRWIGNIGTRRKRYPSCRLSLFDKMGGEE
jgi:hypothetical protein